MTNTTKTNFASWNGETYSGLGDLYELFKSEGFAEFTEDLDHDELLRLAIYAWNEGSYFVPEDLLLLISRESEAYQGEYESEADFTEETLRETATIPADFPDWVVIDYETTWNSALRFDFFAWDVIDINGSFRKFFWNAFI
jgi:hypothetical protein